MLHRSLFLKLKISMRLPCTVLRQSFVWGSRIESQCDQHPSVWQSTA